MFIHAYLLRADIPRRLGESSSQCQKDGGVNGATHREIRATGCGITRSPSATIRKNKYYIKKLLITTLK
jgi:hypothetical protein